MKKITMVFGVVALIAATSSCSKDRVCTCTNSSTQVGATVNAPNVTTYLDSKKHDASLFCVSTSNEVAAVAADFYFTGSLAEAAYTTTSTCELD